MNPPGTGRGAVSEQWCLFRYRAAVAEVLDEYGRLPDAERVLTCGWCVGRPSQGAMAWRFACPVHGPIKRAALVVDGARSRTARNEWDRDGGVTTPVTTPHEGTITTPRAVRLEGPGQVDDCMRPRCQCGCWDGVEDDRGL